MKYQSKTINYAVYNTAAGREHIADTTKVQLPAIENMSDTIKGAGIMGEIDLPSMAMPGSMTTAISLRVDSKTAAKLSGRGTQSLEIVWNIDQLDGSSGSVKAVQHKAFVKGVLKKFDPGSVEPGAQMDGSIEIETLYFKRVIDGETIMEIDKLNNVYRVLGVDLAPKL